MSILRNLKDGAYRLTADVKNTSGRKGRKGFYNQPVWKKGTIVIVSTRDEGVYNKKTGEESVEARRYVQIFEYRSRELYSMNEGLGFARLEAEEPGKLETSLLIALTRMEEATDPEALMAYLQTKHFFGSWDYVVEALLSHTALTPKDIESAMETQRKINEEEWDRKEAEKKAAETGSTEEEASP